MRKLEMDKFAEMLLKGNKADFLRHLRDVQKAIRHSLQTIVTEVGYLERNSAPPDSQQPWCVGAFDFAQTTGRRLESFRHVVRFYGRCQSCTSSTFRHFLLHPAYSYYSCGEVDRSRSEDLEVKYKADVVKQLRAIARQRKIYSWHEFINMSPARLNPRLSPAGYYVLEYLRVVDRITQGLVFTIPAWNTVGIGPKLGPVYGLIGFQPNPTHTDCVYPSYHVLPCRGAPLVSYDTIDSPPYCMPWASSSGEVCLGHSTQAMYDILFQGQIRPAVDTFVRSFPVDDYQNGHGHGRLLNQPDNIKRTRAKFRRLCDFKDLASRRRLPGLIDPTCEVCGVRIPINSPRDSDTRRRVCPRHV